MNITITSYVSFILNNYLIPIGYFAYMYFGHKMRNECYTETLIIVVVNFLINNMFLENFD